MTHVILVTGLLLQCLVGKTDRYHLKREDIEAIRTLALKTQLDNRLRLKLRYNRHGLNLSLR